MAETTYEAGVKLTLDTASAVASASNFQKAIKTTHSVVVGLNGKLREAQRSLMGWTAGQIGVGLGLGAMVHHAFNANMELGKLQKSIAGALFGFQNWKEGVDEVVKVKASMRDAHEILEKFEKTESRLAIPVEELAGAYRYLAGPALGKFGMTSEQTAELTERLAGAAKVLGTDIGTAGMQLTRLLETRSLRGIDPLTNFFRRTIGAGKDLQKMAPDKLIKLLSEKLQGLGPAAEEMSQGMSGAMFRLKDFVSDSLRDIGGPAFKYLSEKAGEFQKHLEASAGAGKKFADVYGEKVVNALKTAVNFASTLLDNWKEIAIIIGGIKLAGMGEAITASGGLLGGLGKFVGELGTAATAVVAFYLVVKKFTEWLDGKQGENIQKAAAGGEFLPRALAAANQARKLMPGGEEEATKLTHLAVSMMRSAGAMTPEGAANRAAIREMVVQMADEQQNALGKSLGLTRPVDFLNLTKISDLLARRIDTMTSLYPAALQSMKTGKVVTPGGVPSTDRLTGPPKVQNNFSGNIYINQKFEDADPDNVYVRLKEDIHRESISKTQHTQSYDSTEP